MTLQDHLRVIEANTTLLLEYMKVTKTTSITKAYNSIVSELHEQANLGETEENLAEANLPSDEKDLLDDIRTKPKNLSVFSASNQMSLFHLKSLGFIEIDVHNNITIIQKVKA